MPRVAPKGAKEATAELRNHHKLLASILKPLLAGQTSPLCDSERRIAGQLFFEIDQILQDLEKQLSQRNRLL